MPPLRALSLPSHGRANLSSFGNRSARARAHKRSRARSPRRSQSRAAIPWTTPSTKGFASIQSLAVGASGDKGEGLYAAATGREEAGAGASGVGESGSAGGNASGSTVQGRKVSSNQ